MVQIESDSIVLIDKPAGMTSFGVVARVRRVLSQQLGKKAKVGHTGTLDPFATGLMILVTGKECKNAGSYSKLDKVYEATIRLGQTSSTGDPEGEITETLSAQVAPGLASSSGAGAPGQARRKTEVEAVLRRFVGEVEQTPPAYSAIKINGQRAYALARKGEEVVMPSRLVTIYSLELVEYDYPLLRIKTHVSSGTYIRTLAEDIGKALGTGAYCQELRRTDIADWSVGQALTLQELGIDS
ncbi:MAG TPA: tRNA pseudouridine(55) synthase TruB [Candidatus Saccharibacteria bacterium]|nr:tRNA pseudouridine(55) synthase TruB [Candidatus Saccharibacteria bacterium]HMR37991.1 tRNA pseudouridine(55) synthase TruB [Candidatus Saccharibacteria bacterium]